MTDEDVELIKKEMPESFRRGCIIERMEMAQLMVAENVAKKAIQKYMNQGEHYKTIFVLVKQDLEALADTLLIEEKQ